MQIQEKLESLGLTPTQLSSVTALFSEVTAEHDRTVKNLKLDHGMQMAFKDNRAKDGKLVKALVDMDKLSLDEESGSIKGLDEQIKSIKESHAYLFENGEPIHNPIAPTGSITLFDTGKSKEWDNSDMIL